MSLADDCTAPADEKCAPAAAVAVLADTTQADAAADEKITRVLMVAGSPEGADPAELARLASQSDYVIAVDAGAIWCKAAGVLPDVFVGDGDSATGDAFAYATEAAAQVKLASTYKDETDLGLAFLWAEDLAAQTGRPVEVTLAACLGGRLDHELGVLGLTRRFSYLLPEIFGAHAHAWVLAPDGRAVVTFDEPGATVSVIPLTDGTVISERGLTWELDHKRLDALSDLGVSNVVAQAGATVTCHEGCCVVILPFEVKT